MVAWRKVLKLDRPDRNSMELQDWVSELFSNAPNLPISSFMQHNF